MQKTPFITNIKTKKEIPVHNFYFFIFKEVDYFLGYFAIMQSLTLYFLILMGFLISSHLKV